jgi:DNA-binding GntR family transcriptional regulator
MRQAAALGDVRAQVEHDVRFHRLVLEAAGNRTLLDVWSSLRVEARTLLTVIAIDHDLHEIAELHVPVREALAAGDAERAGRAARAHVERFGRLVRAAHAPIRPAGGPQ